MFLDEETGNSLRQVLMGLGALLAVSLVIGSVISLMALGAADVVGIAGDDSDAASRPEPSLYIPSRSPEAEPSGAPAQETSPSEPPSPKQSASREKTKKAGRERPRRQITLSVNPERVRAYQRINLRGSYRGANGATLHVQRREGRWVRFPTSATVRGGAFSTYVESGRRGPNRFRVVDRSSGRASNTVTVVIR